MTSTKWVDEAEVVTAERDPGARVADDRLDRRHDVRVGERHRQRLDPHDGVDPGPADDEHVARGVGPHGRVTPRMPRHISSVVPSPQTTYRSGMPRSSGSLSRQAWSWVQVTRIRSPGLTTVGVIETAPLVVEVPHFGVEQGPRPGGAGVEVDPDARPEPVHVAGDGADGRGVAAPCGCTTAWRPAWAEAAVAQQQEPGDHATRAWLRSGPRRRARPPHGRRVARSARGGTAAPPAPAGASCRAASGLRREAQVDGGAVGRRAVEQVVVHLQDEQRALLATGCRCRGRAAARCHPAPTPRPTARRRASSPARLEPGAAEAGPAVAGRRGVAQPGRSGRPAVAPGRG